MDKLTHAGIYGVEASVDALETLYGVDIAYYLRMNFTGFVEVIDALGGVSVYSDREFTVENIRTYQQGYNQLTGIEALAFARERMSFPEGDYQRAKKPDGGHPGGGGEGLHPGGAGRLFQPASGGGGQL